MARRDFKLFVSIRPMYYCNCNSNSNSNSKSKMDSGSGTGTSTGTEALPARRRKNESVSGPGRYCVLPDHWDIMSAVDVFKSAIVRIRDILRGPGVSITGMDSMRHICLYLLSRYITVEVAPVLGIPVKFAWENIMNMIRTQNGGIQYAVDYFYHPQAPDSLVCHFDRLFGTDKFSFDVKTAQKHKEILDILDGVQLSLVDCQMDILGWVYEQHLRTGSTAARDLGQFFTDRAICEYMVTLCAPKFGKTPGVPESVCDPSMGTGGFLTAYMKFFQKAYGDAVDWSVAQSEIHGCDTDPKVAGVARMNLFMESGGRRFDNILTKDSLYGDLIQTGYDVILANMPFGLKGIMYTNCCERVKRLNIPGTKSEPLFLQLMMVSLNPGGRCAVVVPDGMLVNVQAVHNETRKYLLDHFDVRRIIKMTGKFFMNTGIQPSIILFENTGKPTEAVEFWEVKSDKGEMTEMMVLSVPRTNIDASSSFDIRRYLMSENPVANPAGFPMVKLEDVCKVSFGERITKKDNTGTIYPVYGSGGDTFRTDRHNRLGKTCKIGRFAISEVNMVMIINGPYWLMDSGFTVESKNPEIISTEFLWYCMIMDKKKLATLSTGTCQKNIDMDAFYKVEYPCPPLPIQQEIVATLDRIYAPGTTELADTLKMTDKAMNLVLANPAGATLGPIVEAQRLIRNSVQMVVDVKAQMVAIMKASFAAAPKVELGALVTLETGEYITKKTTAEGPYPVYGGGAASHWISRFNREPTCVINKDGVSERCVHLVNERFFLNHHGWTMRLRKGEGENAVDMAEAYLHRQLYVRAPEIFTLATGTCQKGISQKEFLKLGIFVPSRATQDMIMVKVAQLDTQIDALKGLSEQAEENARFMMSVYLSK